ncbi:hypothetical protein JL722_3055 [Aureococcus anophagefferens]|nr:hypothetical protein JL722_3055 [Aureococcus anophagefferens]
MPIATLFDDKKEEKEDEDGGGNELYTGGNHNRGGGGSGLAVVGPGDDDGDGGGDDASKMFASQRNAGEVAPAEGAAKTVVTVYANGFTVGDGPFRPSDGDAADAARGTPRGRPRARSSGGGGGAPIEKPVVDDAAPKTTLQIRLANGKRIRATLNLSHTVGHLDAYVREEGGAGQARRLRGLPPAPSPTPTRPSRPPGSRARPSPKLAERAALTPR